jgi:hypothetical protein
LRKVLRLLLIRFPEGLGEEMKLLDGKWARPGLWSIGKDAGWIVLMGLVCVTTYAVSSFLLKHTHWIRS